MAILGKNIYISIGEGSGATIIAGCRSDEIQVGTEMIEISSPNSSKWREFLDGRSEWSFTVSYLVMANNQVKDLLKSGTKVTVSIVAGEGTAIVVLLQGQAWYKAAKQTFTLGNLAQGSFTFQGTGPLTAPSNS